MQCVSCNQPAVGDNPRLALSHPDSVKYILVACSICFEAVVPSGVKVCDGYYYSYSTSRLHANLHYAVRLPADYRALYRESDRENTPG